MDIYKNIIHEMHRKTYIYYNVCVLTTKHKKITGLNMKSSLKIRNSSLQMIIGFI